MKICVINAHTEAFKPMAQLTTHGNRQDYCDRHGYALHVLTAGFFAADSNPVTWTRLRLMRDLLNDGAYDWAYCCGVDTLHTNFKIRLEDIIDDKFHVIAAADWCAPFQADSFLVRASNEGIRWIDDILSHYEAYKSHPWAENKVMIESMPRWQDIIKIVPQRVLNAYDYTLFEAMYPTQQKVQFGQDFFGHDGRWQPGDFLIHWPSLPIETRMEQIRKTLPRVVK